MNSLRYRIVAMTVFAAFVVTTFAETTHAQANRSLRDSMKFRLEKPPHPTSRSAYRLPDWWIEVPEGGLPRVDFPGNDRISISPVPTPIPHPVSYRERVGISPVPTPIPHPVPYWERVGISPVPTPIPHPGQRRSRSGFNPVSFPPLFDELLEMYADAVLRGDLGAADLIEELIIIVPNF